MVETRQTAGRFQGPKLTLNSAAVNPAAATSPAAAANPAVKNPTAAKNPVLNNSTSKPTLKCLPNPFYSPSPHSSVIARGRHKRRRYQMI